MRELTAVVFVEDLVRLRCIKEPVSSAETLSLFFPAGLSAEKIRGTFCRKTHKKSCSVHYREKQEQLVALSYLMVVPYYMVGPSMLQPPSLLLYIAIIIPYPRICIDYTLNTL